MKRLIVIALTAVLTIVTSSAFASAKNVNVPDTDYSLASPDGSVVCIVQTSPALTYSVLARGNTMLAPSRLALTKTDGTVWGENGRVKKARTRTIDEQIATPFTHRATMDNRCNELLLDFGAWAVIFRAYDNGVAYRFVSKERRPFEVKSETVEYCFDADYEVITPYVQTYEEGVSTFQDQFSNSFENQYTAAPVSKLNPQRLSFLPLMINLGSRGRMAVTETALENYPGLYLVADTNSHKLEGINPPYPKTLRQGGRDNIEMLVETTEDFIAKVPSARAFPWRILMLGKEDIDIANNNLSYILAEPCRVPDTSWIKPGKVAWDWWNDWNIRGVDFRSGINNDTYKYYIDFAAEYGIEYVILDEGWSVNGAADLSQVVPEINLEEIIAYAENKGVGIILWAGYYAFERDMEANARRAAEMGAKGFKIDFMNRDDQPMTDFYYRAAETCARYHLLCDMHGGFKPAGLNITYPNALNFEGVYGLENMKWAPDTTDQMTYDCQLPFIRQTAGPMDYTQGAMRNSTKGNYFPDYSNPMSQGTRCHQLALYITLSSPLNMLCDAPSAYRAEAECTAFIAAVPTVWDDTRVLVGEAGKYIVTARRKGSVWYIGGITNWDERDITFTLPEEIAAGSEATLFCDGINADRNASDYKKTALAVSREMTVHLAPGGGFVLKIN
ncbi:MAG: glycoside hydrolase family 97 protein [Prevotella sp.]|nr:glycoside hydrolase family 97 protein [Prevotella sp.]